jgi:hypothetical protein
MKTAIANIPPTQMLLFTTAYVPNNSLDSFHGVLGFIIGMDEVREGVFDGENFLHIVESFESLKFSNHLVMELFEERVFFIKESYCFRGLENCLLLLLDEAFEGVKVGLHPVLGFTHHVVNTV